MTIDNPGTLPTSRQSNFAEYMPNHFLDYIRLNFGCLPCQ